MNFVDSRCEHEEAEETLPQHSLLEAVYRNQLNHREIILNGLVDDSVVETVVMQIFNFNRGRRYCRGGSQVAYGG